MSSRKTMEVTRRRVLQAATGVGLGSTLFPGALLALASSQASAQGLDLRGWPAITPEMIDAAAAIASVKITDAQKAMMLNGLAAQRNSALRVRELKLANSVMPATVTLPVPPVAAVAGEMSSVRLAKASVLPQLKGHVEDGGVAAETLAFASVVELGALLRAKSVTSVGLTKMYLARLKRLDPTLHFVITLTEERALKQAAERDAELKAGHDRGPLHGIPWGAKDLYAVAGYPTTWGAAGFETQTFGEDAEVVKRLDAAGAVLIAKLSMGALAQGDLWGSAETGARTRNPWNAKQGSSGSSAGSASAVAAGCVGFALGTETLGSIASPSSRCGVVGLRPTYGRVPRTGAMALSWSMDKVGPIARSVEDCALVLQAIQGRDGKDLSCLPSVLSVDFNQEVRRLKVGYLKSAFDLPVLKSDADAATKANFERDAYDAKMVAAALDKLRALGVTLVPCELPEFHFSALQTNLSAEAAAAFDDLTTSGRDALLAGQKPFDWPNSFRRRAFCRRSITFRRSARARWLCRRCTRCSRSST